VSKKQNEKVPSLRYERDRQGGVGVRVNGSRRPCAQTTCRGERIKNKHTKEDFMRRKRSKGEYGTSYIRVRMYTSHSIKQMAGKGSEGKEHVLRNKGDRGVGQSESNRERDPDHCGRVEDKMTERAQTKKAQVGKRFHERMGDYNNDGVRANNEDDKSGNDKIKCSERTPFR